MIFTKAYCCTDFLPKLCLGANTIMNSRCVVAPSLYLPIKLATYLSIFGSIELSFHFLNMYLSTCTYLCIYSSIHLFISISIDLFIYLSTDRFVCISTYLFIYFSTCQFVCLYPSAYTSQTSSYLLVIRMCISRCVFYSNINPRNMDGRVNFNSNCPEFWATAHRTMWERAPRSAVPECHTSH